jgi:hypothetical protein
MKISVALFSNVLFATSILARPSRLPRQVEENQSRSIPTPHFQTLLLANITDEILSATTSTVLSENWAGVTMNNPPTGTTFADIGGSFVVPTPYPSAPGPGTWSGAAWVGIYNGDAIVQAGVIWSVTVSSTGVYSYSYSAVYEWLPSASIQYAITINAGDTISILCAVDQTTYASANCAIENRSTGVFVVETLYAPSSTTLDQGTSAAWIVEDFSTNTGLVPFADFTNVTFTGCFVYAGTQELFPNANTGEVINIVQNNTVLTTVSYPATNEVQINWF